MAVFNIPLSKGLLLERAPAEQPDDGAQSANKRTAIGVRRSLTKNHSLRLLVAWASIARGCRGSRAAIRKRTISAECARTAEQPGWSRSLKEGVERWGDGRWKMTEAPRLVLAIHPTVIYTRAACTPRLREAREHPSGCTVDLSARRMRTPPLTPSLLEWEAEPVSSVGLNYTTRPLFCLPLSAVLIRSARPFKVSKPRKLYCRTWGRRSASGGNSDTPCNREIRRAIPSG